MKPTLEQKILDILENIWYWETTPEDYKKIIKLYLNENKKGVFGVVTRNNKKKVIK